MTELNTNNYKNAPFGYITADFDFNIIDILKCHFRVHNIVTISFRADMVIIQTIDEMPNIDTKGLYTTMITISSLTNYEFECNRSEVNIMVSKKLVTDLPGSSKIGCINVVGNEPFIESDYDLDKGEFNETTYESVEVSFDIIHMHKNVEVINERGISLGIHVNEPYPHLLLKSHLDFSIKEEFVHKILNPSGALGESVLVRQTKAFKSLYSSPNFKIKIGKNGSITFDGSHIGFGVKHRIGFKSEIDFECPRKPFKSLFKFMGSSNVNFEIIKTSLPEFIIRDKYYTTYAAFDRIF